MRLDPKALAGAKMRVRRLTSRSWRVSMGGTNSRLNRFTRNWTAYFVLADTFSAFEELDEWLRRPGAGDVFHRTALVGCSPGLYPSSS